MCSAQCFELNSLLQQYVQNTHEQQRWSWIIFTETQKEQNSYNMTGWLKRLTILKKAEIKETDTHKTQVKDYSDSIWMNLNTDSKDVNNWEVDMKLKMRYEHSENQHWEMCQQLLKDSRKSSRRKSMTLKATRRNKEARSCLKLDKLMKDVWMTINSVSKQLVWKTKSHKIKIVYSQSTQHQRWLLNLFRRLHVTWVSE
jgi:hypothetical protein